MSTLTASNAKTGNQHENTDGFIILNKNPHESLIPALEKRLPSSLPVLRRIQYDCAHPREHAYYVASANLSVKDVTNSDDTASEPWLVAYINLFAGRETQNWIYSSLEYEVLPKADEVVDEDKFSDFSTIDPGRLEIARQQFWGLLKYINRELMPEYMSYLAEVKAELNQKKTTEEKTEEEAKDGEIPKVKKLPYYEAPAMLFGSVHTGLFRLLTTNDSYLNPTFRPGLKVHRYDALPYVKYVFDPKIFQTSDGQSNSLPPGFYYGKDGLLPEHVELVRSRTHIPREPKTLLSMPSVVIYDESAPTPAQPIAWGFFSFEGSLATLHVEPEYRGKGLATILAKEVMRRGMKAGPYGSESDGANRMYAFANVAKDNFASRKVMEKVGGKGWRWTVTWTVLEVLDESM